MSEIDYNVKRNCIHSLEMPSVLKRDKDLTIKKRRFSDLSVKIENVKEKKVNFEIKKLVTHNESFFESVWPVIYVAQFMGFMPLQGVRTKDPVKYEFRWKTIRVLVTLLYFLLGGLIAEMYLQKIAKIGINAKNIVNLVFYSCCLFGGVLFLLLAQKFKRLAIAWQRFEKVFLNLPYKECGWRLSTKIRITAAAISFVAIVEHIMAQGNTIYNFYMKINICQVNVNDKWQHFFLYEYPHVFAVLPYNFVFTIFTQWIITSLTFGWNYMDIFIIVTSIGLATRFKQINQRLEEMENNPIDEPLWAEIRHHYVLLCELVETVDKYISGITLLSCTNNLYFICYQLLNIFNVLPYLINYVYFWFSLSYLIGRTIVLFLIASSINDAAAYPVKFVRQRRTTEWCSELERFGDQISTQVVALSGMKFFFITRSLLFGMAGTIVTYELVLLQFDTEGKNSQNSTSTYCDSI
ncbi:Gustatory receptor for sugar taste 64a [Pseudolycoriella hygida]|uniref:Gustatory receptor n=1 Tax=Pseudolycoriella hygida TaxID=35572 RepID=A0A9Q0MP09_9DIPT|nr:Gustatory receptor for sugar taste 64a [Pseudolycoriella hygida]